MWCASKAAESASARLCADAEAKTTYELGVSYSPDTEEGSVLKAVETKPPAKLGIYDATRRSIFGSSDESDEPSPKRRRSSSRDSGAHSGVGSPIDTTSQRGASTSVGTSQEERDRNVLRLAPEKKSWMLPKSVMDACRRRQVIAIEQDCSIRQGSITLTPVRKTIALRMNSS
uniref:Uncharacterized protein n=1 Tax=Peronospora matthiolae TaxID=2874970 RepID=A0AAV1T995_9STRA